MSDQVKKTILLIDDEKVVNEYITDLLTDEGYLVLSATNGLNGLEVFCNNLDTIDLVLLDMVMPKLNGTDCFYELKEIDPDVKVIVISGYTRLDGVEYLLKDGVKDFIKKPFKGTSLIDTIEKVINY